MSRMPLELTVNGEPRTLETDPRRTLLEVLRDHLHLKGAKRGCNQGVCGACTVLADGRPVRSCISLAANVGGCSITTIEGLARDGQLDPLQQAFLEHGAVQCGFCTAGVVMTCRALLDEGTPLTVDSVRHAIGGNLCRCSGYVKIVDAVLAAAGGTR